MYKLRTINYVIHRKGDSPIFGESRTEVRLNDEANGCFLEIEQEENSFGNGGVLRLDFEEISLLIQAIENLRKESELIEQEEKEVKDII